CLIAAALAPFAATSGQPAPLQAATAILANASSPARNGVDEASGAPEAGNNETGEAQAGGSDASPATSIRRIRGFLPDLRFSLQGSHGKTVTQEAVKDKVVMQFFGYASCPDISLSTMAQLSQVVNTLGKRADQVRIVFNSVDPHRDTPQVLQSY